jgi:hypothetical protein
MRKSYHIRFMQNGRQVEMTLRAWARANQHYFPQFRFTNTQDDHPITHQIRDYCVNQLNARLDETERRVVVIL